MTWLKAHWKATLALGTGAITNALALGLLDGTARTYALWAQVAIAIPLGVALGPANVTP